MISVKKSHVFQSIYAGGFESYLYEKSLSVSRRTLEGERYYAEALDRHLAGREPEAQRFIEKTSTSGWDGNQEKKRPHKKGGLALRSVSAGICRKQTPPSKSLRLL